jgi:predicted Holliday junction resolvase-like endonuclease
MKDHANGIVPSLLNFYKHEKRIFGRCPQCQEPFRLSDVKLTYGKEPPKDMLARMKGERDRLKSQLEEVEADIEGLKEDHESELEDLKDSHDRDVDVLNEKWENKVGTEVDRQLVKTIRQIRADAVARARACQLGKTLEKIAPMFPGFGHHPCDVRPIFDPIDFVIFDGYFQGEVTDITFVEFKTGESRPTQVQNSIRSAVEKKRVHFEVKRLNKEMIRMITTGQPLKLKRFMD